MALPSAAMITHEKYTPEWRCQKGQHSQEVPWTTADSASE